MVEHLNSTSIKVVKEASPSKKRTLRPSTTSDGRARVRDGGTATSRGGFVYWYASRCKCPQMSRAEKVRKDAPVCELCVAIPTTQLHAMHATNMHCSIACGLLPAYQSSGSAAHYREP